MPGPCQSVGKCLAQQQQKLHLQGWGLGYSVYSVQFGRWNADKNNDSDQFSEDDVGDNPGENDF